MWILYQDGGTAAGAAHISCVIVWIHQRSFRAETAHQTETHVFTSGLSNNVATWK